MKKILILSGLLISFLFSYGQDELKIWNEFILLVKNNQITENRVKPIDQIGDKFKPILLGFLDSVRTQASPSDWTNVPEIIKINNRIQFLVPWSVRGQKVNYCFSFVVIDSQWFFQHLESIFIRLDKISSPPVSTFPDVSESKKAWVREEKYWSFVILNVYLRMVKEKGKDYALVLLKDGGGYFLESKTWVPFTSPQNAFILYLCWEQANLRGNKVTLEKFTDNQAIVTLKTMYFDLYFQAGHFKSRISIEDYKQIFETMWQDRAKEAGWNLDIKYSTNFQVTFKFTRNK